MRPAAPVRCPYCGEKIWMEVDEVEGSVVPEFIEDCEVCCHPIEVSYAMADGEVTDFEAAVLE